MGFIMAKKRIREDESIKLNITSMMDMFTIILIFLLKSYSVDPVNIVPHDNLMLPVSTSETPPSEGLTIAVLRDKLVFEKRDIIPLKNGAIEAKYLGKDKKTIPTLAESLKKELEKSKFIAKHNPNYEFKGTILIQADKGISFKTLKKIMYTTGVSGYSDFKFTVVGKE